MKRRILTAAVIVLLIVAMTSTAYAATPRAILILPSLEFDGMTAKCAVAITANTNDEIKATIKLWKDSDVIATWNVSEVSYIKFNDEVTVTGKGEYKLTVDTTINGEAKQQFSDSATCS